jgi:hypothetical protein
MTKARASSLTTRDLQKLAVSEVKRSPSTPSLRPPKKPMFPSAVGNLPTIEDDPPQLPIIVPSITLSTELKDPSSASSASSLSSEESSNQPSTAATSPTSHSISSSSDAEHDENDIDVRTFLAAPRLTQRVRLKSGRVVSFSEVGDRNGFPVFVFLGMGCVRYFIAFFDDLASSYGLRLICPDRPGVGLSDDVKADEQQVLKWPGMVSRAAQVGSTSLLSQSFVIFTFTIMQQIFANEGYNFINRRNRGVVWITQHQKVLHYGSQCRRSFRVGLRLEDSASSTGHDIPRLSVGQHDRSKQLQVASFRTDTHHEVHKHSRDLATADDVWPTTILDQAVPPKIWRSRVAND